MTIGRGEGNGMCYGVDNGIGITEENCSRIHKSPWKKSPESSQEAAGKIYMFYSPSQGRVRYFPNQETETPEWEILIDKLPQILLPSSILPLCCILCFPGGKCPQNRYFKEQLSLVDCSWSPSSYKCPWGTVQDVCFLALLWWLGWVEWLDRTIAPNRLSCYKCTCYKSRLWLNAELSNKFFVTKWLDLVDLATEFAFKFDERLMLSPLPSQLFPGFCATSTRLAQAFILLFSSVLLCLILFCCAVVIPYAAQSSTVEHVRNFVRVETSHVSFPRAVWERVRV